MCWTQELRIADHNHQCAEVWILTDYLPQPQLSDLYRSGHHSRGDIQKKPIAAVKFNGSVYLGNLRLCHVGEWLISPLPPKVA
jgi:hypothetical protein